MQNALLGFTPEKGETEMTEIIEWAVLIFLTISLVFFFCTTIYYERKYHELKEGLEEREKGVMPGE